MRLSVVLCSVCVSLGVFLPLTKAVGSGLTETHDGDVVFAASILQRDILIQTVLDRNPSVEAARLAWLATVETETQARSLSDPSLSYSMAPQTITDGDVRYGQVLRVAQRFPFPGTLKLQGRIAGAEAEASFEESPCFLTTTTSSIVRWRSTTSTHDSSRISNESLPPATRRV